ncbi:MAG: SigE family RNA polymerase sigma factor [Acidimicrobiia bacterium]|nr:SigE family RNA polymerase sigma factor [Acidimicrobiia bacterium]MCY4433041.1 SigE family RNA polymerase sigma factor [bacterium]
MVSEFPEGELSVTPESAPADEVIALASFDDLYRDEYEPMVRLARGLVDAPEIAEEIVQDAFARVYERWSRLDHPGGYLRTAVVNGARSELRKREVRRRIGLRPFIPPQPEDRDYLHDALHQLSPRQKTALVLRFYADMTEREIAQAMGVRPGTVKSATSRGLAELRKVVEQ